MRTRMRDHGTAGTRAVQLVAGQVGLEELGRVCAGPLDPPRRIDTLTSSHRVSESSPINPGAAL